MLVSVRAAHRERATWRGRRPTSPTPLRCRSARGAARRAPSRTWPRSRTARADACSSATSRGWGGTSTSRSGWARRHAGRDRCSRTTCRRRRRSCRTRCTGSRPVRDGSCAEAPEPGADDADPEGVRVCRVGRSAHSKRRGSAPPSFCFLLHQGHVRGIDRFPDDELEEPVQLGRAGWRAAVWSIAVSVRMPMPGSRPASWSVTGPGPRPWSNAWIGVGVEHREVASAVRDRGNEHREVGRGQCGRQFPVDRSRSPLDPEVLVAHLERLTRADLGARSSRS